MARSMALFGLLPLALVGCLPFDFLQPEEPFAQVPSDPFAKPPVVTKRAKVNFKPGDEEICRRVDAMGRVLAAHVGLQPHFATIGSPEPEMFHVGPIIVYITDGLVRQCPTDPELAAVLASELGRMVAEREAVASRQVREYDPPPPIALPIGGNGYGPAADPTHQIEMAKYEKQHPKTKAKLPIPDPKTVAENVLTQAGYDKAVLATVQPLLLNAEKSCTFERQFKGLGPAGDWQP